MRSRTTLLGLAAVLLLIGIGLVAWRAVSTPVTLRLAVGPASSEDTRLAQAAAQYLAREHEDLRFRIVPTAGEPESAKALDDGRADLAIVRTDAGMPTRGQTVAIWHRDAVLLVAPDSRGITSIGDLRGRTVGIVRRLPANARLLDLLLAQQEVPREAVRTVELDGPEDVEAAFRSGRIDVALAVGTLAGRMVGGTIAAATAASGGAAPIILPVTEVDAIAQRSPLYEKFEIVRGAFGGTPPRPADPVRTLGVSHRLVAASTISDSTISDLTKTIFQIRPALARDVELANRIEAPDTDKGASLPLHPGADAYYEGEVETFFDRYSDWIYLSIMGVSILGSGLAGLASRATNRKRTRTLGLLDRLLAIVRQARLAPDGRELDALESETDDILGVALGQAGTGRLGEAGISAFTLGLEQARHAIADRRRALAGGRPLVAAAAG